MINFKTLTKQINDILIKYPETIEICNNKESLRVSFECRSLYKDWCKFLHEEYNFSIVDINKNDDKHYLHDFKMLLKAKQFLREKFKE